MINTHLTTLAQVNAALNALSDELKNKALKAGIAKVAAAGVAAMKGEIEVDTGATQQSISRKALTARDKIRLGLPADQHGALVAPLRKVRGRFRSKQANILDIGARPHVIKAGKTSARLELLYAQGLRQKAKYLRFMYNGRLIMKQEINHPGTRGTLFVQAADQQLGSQAEQIFYTTLSQYLSRLNPA